MGMGVVSDNEFESELEKFRQPESKQSESKQSVIIQDEDRGRGVGNTAIPDSVQKIIGETSVIEGRKAATQLAAFFGVSDSSVSAYANGAASTASYHSPKPELKSHIDKRRAHVINRARRTMLTAIDCITEDKLKIEKPSTLSAVAKDMSVIIKNMEPSRAEPGVDGDSVTNQPFVIFAPQFRDERSFEVINVQNQEG